MSYSKSLSSWNNKNRLIILDIIKKRHISNISISNQIIPYYSNRKTIDTISRSKNETMITNNHYKKSPMNWYTTTSTNLMSYKNNKPYKCNDNNNITAKNKKNEVKIIDVSTQIDILSKKKRTYDNAKLIDTILKQIVRQERYDFQSLLHEQNRNKDDMQVKLKATTDLYIKVLKAWSNCRADNAPIKAEEILRHMFNRHLYYTQEYDELDSTTTSPTVMHFIEVMNAWVTSQRDGYEQRCEELLRWMEMWYNATDGCELLRPDTEVFNRLIKVWSGSTLEDAPYRAEDVLRRMGKLHQSGNINAAPNVSSFHLTIKAWAKSNHDKKAYKSQELLTLMESFLLKQSSSTLKPNKFIYITVLQTWINTCKQNKDPALPYYVDYIIKRMIYLYTNHNIQELKPNVVIYNFGFSAWSLSNLVEAPKNANALYQSMLDSNYCHPNTKTYTLLLKTWAKHYTTNKESINEVYKLLNQLAQQKNAQPNIQHFNIVFSTLFYTKFDKTKKERNDIVRITFQTYRLLLKLQEQNDIKPNTMIYYKIIQICCKHIQNEKYLINILSSLLLHIVQFQQDEGNSTDGSIIIDHIWKLLKKNVSNDNYENLHDYYLNKQREILSKK